ncbi:MAG: enoyl-CoA hydratase/isomerase family protein [Chloroflexi bacterium]|nr:enoyl-CoA hydratase/isomerase family protein [Chloroflexota bacterium]
MAYKAITYEKKGRIAYVTLNRPEVANAHNGVMGRELREAWEDANKDENIWVAILTGAGDKHFCTGADMRAATEGESGGGGWGDIPEDFWKPVILAINGVCAGGGWHFVWQSDFAIASEHATFLEPHVSVGWVPLREMLGAANRMPLSAALRMAMLGTKERMTAQRAFDLGVITEVVPQTQLMPRATEIAGWICEQAPLAVQSIKEVLHRAYELRYAQREVFEYGNMLREFKTHHSEDYLEGPRAFVQKRKPVWKGK